MKNKIYIIGNSCSGKTTFAKKWNKKLNISFLELDTIYQTSRAEQRLQDLFVKSVSSFMESNKSWIIEGVYTQVSDIILAESNYLVYLDVDKNEVLENAKKLPNSESRVKFVESYYQDERKHITNNNIIYSKGFHDKVYDNYNKKKIKLKTTHSHEVY